MVGILGDNQSVSINNTDYWSDENTFRLTFVGEQTPTLLNLVDTGRQTYCFNTRQTQTFLTNLFQTTANCITITYSNIHANTNTE